MTKETINEPLIEKIVFKNNVDIDAVISKLALISQKENISKPQKPATPPKPKRLEHHSEASENPKSRIDLCDQKQDINVTAEQEDYKTFAQKKEIFEKFQANVAVNKPKSKVEKLIDQFNEISF